MFNQGIRLPFKLLGIPLLLDWSFLFILPLLAWIIGSRVGLMAQMFGLPAPDWLTEGWMPYMLGLIAAIGLFVGVVLHELGHAVTARAYGVQVRSITLWFLGGVARFEDLPRHRGAEAVVAIVGPLVSLALAALCWGALRVMPTESIVARFILAYLAYMNVVLAIFNMIPALPLDGGRVLRSLLSLWLPFVRATQISGWISRTFAVLLALVGLLGGNFFLLIIAIFIFFAVTTETTMVRVEELLRDIPVQRLMNPQVSTISPEAPIEELSALVWRDRHTSFPVIDAEGHVLGIVSVADVENKPPSTAVGAIMRREFPTVAPEANAADAFRAMTRNDYGGVLVIDQQRRLAGIITKTDLMRAIQLRESSAQMDAPAARTPAYG